jgi:AraC-like DNA-binding protein
MDDPLRSVLLALPVATAGVMLALAAGMLRTERPLVRWTGVAFMLSVGAYAVKLWNDEVHVLPDALLFVRAVIGNGGVGLFCLFVTAVFDDEERPHPGMLAAVAALTAVGVAGEYAEGAAHLWLGVITNLMRIALALAALISIVRGWKGDLVEPRRRLRGPLFATVSAYIVANRALSAFGLDALGAAPDWYLVTNAAVLFLIASAAAFVFLESRGELFEAAPIRSYKDGRSYKAGQSYKEGRIPALRISPEVVCGDRAMQADLVRVQAVMETQQVWREEGLTIASLSVRVNVPEAQLRRLINDQLGYRNFPSFVNAHRVAAAKARLADPDEARVAVSAIAFELGFGSLGPFNRAFREETGVSPSEWRRQALGLPVVKDESA